MVRFCHRTLSRPHQTEAHHWLVDSGEAQTCLGINVAARVIYLGLG